MQQHHYLGFEHPIGESLCYIASRGEQWVAVAVDGKSLRRSHAAGQAAPHLLISILHQEAAVVAQMDVKEKTNEIPKLPALLAPLPLEGPVVTADALHTQKETDRYLVEEKQADYLFIANDHQPTLRHDIADLHLESILPQHTMIDKGHGRVEVRSLWTSTELCGYLDFPYAGQVFTVRREVTEIVAQKSCCETVQGLSSQPVERAAPACLLVLSRGHWTIENRLHGVRDVTFDEDRSRVRTGAGAQVMASLRNLAISLLRLAGARYVAPALRLIRLRLWRDPEVAVDLLALLCKCVFVRTTVDLPNLILRQVKSTAALSNSTLNAFIPDAWQRAVRNAGGAPCRRVRLPLVRRPQEQTASSRLVWPGMCI